MFPFKTKEPPAFTLTTTVAVPLTDPGSKLPFIVKVPVAAEKVRHVALPLAGPVIVGQVIVKPPAVTENPPPTAAVPPPTNVPALDALVIKFTLTLVSIVTVKLLL
jgi:hypothetical protein